MAILNILHYPDPRLKKPAQEVSTIDESVQQLVDDMLETMYDAPGIGLAATQINVSKRIIVMDITEDKSEPRVFINPQILQYDGEIKTEEGCLSVPGIYEMVARYEKIRVRALGRSGEPFEITADQLLAVCIQHEIDHLDGKLFVEYLSIIKQQRIKKKIIKMRRKTL